MFSSCCDKYSAMFLRPAACLTSTLLYNNETHYIIIRFFPDLNISTPRFSGSSWLALRALRGAYKRVRLRLRVRPERARGVLLLTGEHDDLSGDYLALLLRNGHVELRSVYKINNDMHPFNHRLSINRPPKRGKEKSSSDGHCQCEKGMDDH
jgi:hypothetical protein